MLRRTVLAFSLCSVCFAQCSLNTVRGTWGYYSQGTLMMNLPGGSGPVPVPYAGLGLEKIDNQGQFTVQGSLNAGGQVQAVNFTGSIQVNPDCTSTDTYTVPRGSWKRYGPADHPRQRQRNADDGNDGGAGGCGWHRSVSAHLLGGPAVHRRHGSRCVRRHL